MSSREKINKKVYSKQRRRVLVAMSGGVDSSVAALLLKKRGFDVTGAFIRGYNVDGCQDKDAEDARLVAEHIGVPFYVFNFEDEYKNKVVDYLLDGYRKGITPNPDVVCNTEIKFGILYDKAMEMGFDFVASGHYARSARRFSIGDLRFKNKIYQAKDKNKDQTYFLWNIPKEKFGHILFPLGKLKKSKVRSVAKKAGLPTADKKDSQGICFLGKFRFDDFLKERVGTKIGDVVDAEGNKMGEHDGAWLYTIGQKHGFKNWAGEQLCIIDKNIEKNQLIVVRENDPRLLSEELQCSRINFLDEKIGRDFASGKPAVIYVRTRYRQPLKKALLQKNEAGHGYVKFFSPDQIFPASGQSVVFYKKNGQMLGGGVIV